MAESPSQMMMSELCFTVDDYPGANFYHKVFYRAFMDNFDNAFLAKYFPKLRVVFCSPVIGCMINYLMDELDQIVYVPGAVKPFANSVLPNDAMREYFMKEYQINIFL